MKIMAVDIGGTSIKSAVCIEGDLNEVKEHDTNASLGGAHVMETVKHIIHSYKHYGLERIGVSTAGQVDTKKGVILYANENIPGYTGMPVKQQLFEAFSIPVFVENDVNAAAIGEACYGAGVSEKDFVCLTYGTGVGGAIFMDGLLFHGSSSSAAEFGAMIVHPEERDAARDLFSGCYERYASTTALVQKAKAYDITLTSGREVCKRLEEPGIKRLVDAWIEEIIYGLITVIHMLNPSKVILGGGIMEQEYILKEIKCRIPLQIMPSYRGVQIIKAKLGNRAGLLGACAIAGGKNSGEYKFIN